jgi:MFS family permease
LTFPNQSRRLWGVTLDPTPATPQPTEPATTRGASRRARRPGLGRDYWKLWTGSVISNLGDGTSTIAYPWLASVLTRDPVLIAAVGVATRLPWLLFSLHAGAIVDRGDRRLLMVRMNALRAGLSGLVAVLVLTGTMTIPALLVLALLLGCAEVVYDNAAQTILPRLVPKDRLERANGNLWGAEMVANQFVGPPLGGVLIAIGLAVPFFLDAGTFAVAGALVLLIGGSFRTAPEEVPGGAVPPVRPSLRADIAEGFRWLWDHDLLRTLAIALGVMNMASAMAFATYVLFAQEILGLSATGFGILMTAGAIGGVLGSVLGAGVSRRLGPGPSLWAVLVGGVVTNVVIGLTSVTVIVGVAATAFSFSAMLWNVITVSLRQRIIPDRLLGRVNSVYRFFGWGGMPIGALLAGVTVRLAEPAFGRTGGLRAPFLVAAALSAVIMVAVGGRLTTARIAAAEADAAARQRP